jgi:hypothetical protein
MRTCVFAVAGSEGHEALLLAEPAPAKPRLSLAVQQWFELMGEPTERPDSQSRAEARWLCA